MAGLSNNILRIILLLAAAMLLPAVQAEVVDRTGFHLNVVTAIGPATEDYVGRALDVAEREGAELVILQMDTPGGLDTSMRGIIKRIINSTVPVVGYVAPGGARAASAGTYILYASHIAAMAPGTNLGAASPVQIGGIPLPGGKTGDQGSTPAADVMTKKITNDAVAYIRGLAQLRGRNQEWAEQAVRAAASLPAEEALKQNVIDLVATDMRDLLAQLDGREVLVNGRSRILDTSELALKEVTPDWRSRFLAVITDPNIAYILMLVGIYGLIFEFSNPGAIVPGTIGAISLLLAMYAFQLLPINYAGMGLILLGVALMIAESFQPSFGVLGIGGAAAFVFGSIILIDTDAPGFGIDISVIVTFALISVLVFVVIVGMALKARRRPVVSGLEELVGGEAMVLEDFKNHGRVAIHSENWRARADTPLRKGQRVKITGIKGLTLQVEPLDTSTQEKE